MRVLIDVEPLHSYPNGGIPVYTHELIKGITEIAGDDVEFVAAHAMMRPFNEKRIASLVEREGLRVALSKIRLPVRMAKCSATLSRLFMDRPIPRTDLIHAVSYVPPGYLGFKDVPLVSTIHDLAFLRHPGKGYVPNVSAANLESVSNAAKRARLIIAVSEFTKREICGLLDVPSGKVHVIYEGSQFAGMQRVPDNEAVSIAKRHGLEPGRFFLSVGTVSPRKNFETVLDAFSIFRKRNPGWKLAICGQRGWACESLVKRLERTEDVVWIRKAGTRDLMALYQSAKAFFLLSHYEGFGIPVLEAMTFGCPVCYAGGSSMEEIAGDCGIRIAATDVAAAGEGMERFATDKAYCDAESLKCLERSSIFSWDKVAAETLDCYREVFKNGAKSS